MLLGNGLNHKTTASIAQLGERKTEDLKVTGSIPVRGILFFCFVIFFVSIVFVFINSVLN
jgi:hypothetical protein